MLFRSMQAAFAEVLHLLGQLLPWSPAPSLRTLTHGIAAMVARRTATRPVRSEVLQVRNAIQCDLAVLTGDVDRSGRLTLP